MRDGPTRDTRVMTVGLPARHAGPEGVRVVADVDGAPLWFESSDLALEPSIEAFACALLVPALERGTRLELPAPIDPVLRDGLGRLVPVFREWWGYGEDAPGDLVAGPAPATARAEAAASCFTGGVDSFYDLLARGMRTDVLLFVHGYDMPLADRERIEHFRRALTRVAGEVGARAVVVRSNLREHPLAGRVPWERWHGGALAAAGHTCAGAIGTLRIPPSYRMGRLRPWGSDPRVDPHLSSSRLTVLHPECHDGRIERIKAIGDHPLVREHLRVCYENRAPFGNCSRCEKCVSTMTSLDGFGYLERSRVFDRSVPLPDLLDGLPYVRHHGLAVWRDIAALDHRPEVKAALTRLLRRTPGPLKRAWWKLLSWSRRGAAAARDR